MQVAELIVLANVPQRYSYRVPDELAISVGDFVDIIFANRAQVGLVVETSMKEAKDFSFKLADIQQQSKKGRQFPLNSYLLLNGFHLTIVFQNFELSNALLVLKKPRDNAYEHASECLPLPRLSTEQQTVYENIVTSNCKTHVLHGVTGSGKTQIYAKLIETVIHQGQSAIILIPEISLTPQFTSFFSTLFQRVAVVHSGLTPKNKEIIWNQCLRGEIDVIVGPRSAIFMPLTNLGLIIVDEEHDTSYKQESTPRYYTHDVVEFRAKQVGATLVFGSATPSLVTYTKAKSDDVHYHALLKRYNNITMPKVHVLDMAQTQQNMLIHDQLLAHIEATIQQKKKVLLLVNRRGYSSFLKCTACGAVQECKACQTSFTYHSDGYFRCHRCMATKRMSRQCSECGHHDVEYYGIAIQKVAFELKRLYPDAEVTRIDRDTVKSFDDLQAALSDVDRSDILIGTQMISKGHNFANVALVGIIGVDTMLNFPDFRSSERMFQLMTQMAGRAGRDMSGTDVYIQTFQPNHYVFPFVQSHDVQGFLDQEQSFREPFGYPPFKQMVNVIFSATDNKKALSLYKDVTVFNQEASKRLDIMPIGPKVAPIEKVSGYFRHNVFYKVSKTDMPEFKKLLTRFPKKSGIRCVVDIDPQSLL